MKIFFIEIREYLRPEDAHTGNLPMADIFEKNVLVQ